MEVDPEKFDNIYPKTVMQKLEKNIDSEDDLQMKMSNFFASAVYLLIAKFTQI